MKRSLVSLNDPILVKHAEPIAEDKITSLGTQTIIDELLDVAFGHGCS